MEYVCAREGCDVDFEQPKTWKKKYCSRSCAAKVNNLGVNRHGNRVIPPKKCANPDCLSEFKKYHKSQMYCSVRCFFGHKSWSKVQDWLSGEWDGSAGTRRLSRTIREYLLEQANYQCQQCGFDTPHPLDGSTILEIDHINGDGEDHRPENLRVLCPNCHALTSTYRARNIGKGRNVYYLRVRREAVGDERVDREDV